MSYLALYREWRPLTFDEVVEQKHAVYALRQSVISGQIGHAYLFSGTRGTGKTTLAKIFSRAINCLNPQGGNPCNQCAICRGILDGSLLDVVEMDAASNNSVDNIRRICDEVVFMPTLARYKVYIVDEVHMLSAGAFNALLKTLEEPPAHAVFILATTEPHRIPATILSRCQRYDFRRIPVEGISARLREIAVSDRIDIEPAALETIAAFADGAMRDAISLLDQARSSCQGQISRDDILSLAGIAQDEVLLAIAQALSDQNASIILERVDQLMMAGRDLARFITDLAQFYRNLLVCQVSSRPEKLIQATAESLQAMRELARSVPYSDLIRMIRGLSSLLAELRWAGDTRTLLEVGLLRLMTECTGAGQAAPVLAQAPARLPAAASPAAASRKPEAATVSVLKSTPDAAAVSVLKSTPTAVPAAAPVTTPTPAAAPARMPDARDFSQSRADEEPPPFSDDDIPPPDEPGWPQPSLDAAASPLAATRPEPAGRTSRRTQAPPSAAAEFKPKNRPLPPADLAAAAGFAAETANGPSVQEAARPVAKPKTKPATELPVAPVAAPAAEPPAELTKTTLRQAIDVSDLWHQVLDSLTANGHMTLYLFGRTAAVSLCDKTLQVIFAPHEQVHCQELQQAAAQKILRETLFKLTGQDYQLAVMLAEDPQAAAASCALAPEDEWIQKLRQTADNFGIPLKMEE